MKIRQYILFLLILSPLILGIYADSPESTILVPNQEFQYVIRGNGQIIEVQATADIHFTLERIEGEDLVLIEELNLNRGEVYSYTFEYPAYFQITVISSSIAELTVTVLGIPSSFFILTITLAVLTLIFYRDEILILLKIRS